VLGRYSRPAPLGFPVSAYSPRTSRRARPRRPGGCSLSSRTYTPNAWDCERSPDGVLAPLDTRSRPNRPYHAEGPVSGTSCQSSACARPTETAEASKDSVRGLGLESFKSSGFFRCRATKIPGDDPEHSLAPFVHAGHQKLATMLIARSLTSACFVTGEGPSRSQLWLRLAGFSGRSLQVGLWF
jgi:hypothetical protein